MRVQRNIADNQPDNPFIAIDNITSKFLIFVAITLIGTQILQRRPACHTWNEDIDKIESLIEHAKSHASSAEKTYWDRARLNCNHYYDQRLPGAVRNSEALEFCPALPKDKIPSFWSIDQHFCESDYGKRQDQSRLPGMPLTCYAKQALKTQNHYEKLKNDLALKVVQKPFQCKARVFKGK